ncbi:MAG TPA: hypothetical protein DD708_04440 [Deltaproteobacteria bacterium]|nr:hypothetical protein [Deltaproteobacteria bacterium]
MKLVVSVVTGRCTLKGMEVNQKMNKRIWIALVLTALGVLTALFCLYRTTPYTITQFFFVGWPCIILGVIVYVVDVVMQIRKLQQEAKHQVVCANCGHKSHHR